MIDCCSWLASLLIQLTTTFISGLSKCSTSHLEGNIVTMHQYIITMYQYPFKFVLDCFFVDVNVFLYRTRALHAYLRTYIHIIFSG